MKQGLFGPMIPLKNKTEYSLVYLHGFSASQAEGDPVHRNIAKLFGCNLYLSRLAEHGIDTAEPMMNLTAEEKLGICRTGACNRKAVR